MQACITLDLEPDHASRALPRYDGWTPERLGELFEVLRRHGAPLTAFVVGRSLLDQKQAVRSFVEQGFEVELHSHTHDLSAPDSLTEIREGVRAFEDTLGRRPRGYRAPEGRISHDGWRRLQDEGFAYDSSIFPSLWPAPRYLRYRPAPFRPEGLDLVELPVSTLTPARLIVSLSWFKLLGWRFYSHLLERVELPDPLVFDMHLHDLWRLPAFDTLPLPWSAIYGRNQGAGLTILDAFLTLVARRGARFTTLGRVVETLPAVA